MGRDDWPLTGRDDLVAGVLRHLADPTCGGVFLVGARGVGTTRVLDEVHQRLVEQQRPTNRAVCSLALHTVPFGAISHSIPGDLRPAGAPLDSLELFDRLRAIIGLPRSAAHRFTTCVDDIRWLDAPSTGLLTQLMAANLATVVATVREDEVLPEALETLERSFPIRRVVVPALERDEMLRLIDAALDGPVDGPTAVGLATAAQGLPFYLAEILDGSIAAGTLSLLLGTWTLRGMPTVTPRLARLFDHVLDRLDRPRRELVELVAFAEPVTLRALETSGLLDEAVALEADGVLRTVDGPPAAVRLAQPLLAAQVRSRTSPLRRRALLPKAVELVQAGATDADLVRLVVWRLECGQAVPLEELEKAAARTRAANDFETTEELAAAAVAVEPTVSTLLLQAEALHDLCRFEEADDVMRHAATFVHDDPSLLRLHILRHRLLFWGRHDADASIETMREAIAGLEMPLLRDFARVAIANTLVFCGRIDEMRHVVAELETQHHMVTTAMYFPQVHAALYQGRVGQAVALAREGLRQRAAYPSESHIGHAALSTLALGVSLIEAGSFAEAEQVLATGYQEVTEQRIPQLHTWLALSRGRAALFQGRVGEARRWFTEARSVAERARFSMGERIALTGLLVCAGHLRDASTAVEAELALLQLPADHGHLWPERMYGLAWAAVAKEQAADGVAMLLAGADEALLRGERLLEVELLYEAARIGDARVVANRMKAAMNGLDSPLLASRALWVQGAASGDEAVLARAEKELAHLGAFVAAAEAASDLARVHHLAGRRRDALGAANRAAQYLAGSVGVMTPRLGRTPAGVDLSQREQEIAELAAVGTASKVIAQQLGLSVRTVSNHLQNTYLKLGISGRDELRDALRVR